MINCYRTIGSLAPRAIGSLAVRIEQLEYLAEVARLVRQFHDLTAGTPLAGDQEVVCHNDLSPKNTVYRDDREGMRPGNGLSVLLRWSS